MLGTLIINAEASSPPSTSQLKHARYDYTAQNETNFFSVGVLWYYTEIHLSQVMYLRNSVQLSLVVGFTVV